jgi:hypothetical protein
MLAKGIFCKKIKIMVQKLIKARPTVGFRGSALRNAICFVLQLVIIQSDLSGNFEG